MRSAHARTAVDSVKTPGIWVTGIPSPIAAVRSMISDPIVGDSSKVRVCDEISFFP
jgi:hypothetical protein